METTRRGFLGAVAAGVAWAALAGAVGCEPAGRLPAKRSPERAERTEVRARQALAFRSRPDLRPPPGGGGGGGGGGPGGPPGPPPRPPAVEVVGRAGGTAPGRVFLAPKKDPEMDHPVDAGQDGPMIVDDSGRLVWFRPLSSEDEDAMDFKAQSYRGEPVLTWWEGHHTGYGRGEYVVLDASYREVARVRAGDGREGDHHEFLITPRDTALITAYAPERADLSSVGGRKHGPVLDGVVQEVDIATGKVVFEWRSLEHVGVEESHYEPPEDPGQPFDYFHVNSVAEDRDGNLLVSARRTSAVYKIDRNTGEVLWRLGGKKSDFTMDPRARRAYQHDARRRPDGALTIFDNGVLGVDERSRGIVLELDEDAMTATFAQEYAVPDGRLADTQGNMQTLPNGNVFIGWGSEPNFSEFSADGELLLDASLPPDVESYRSFRFPWVGRPGQPPALAAERGPGEEVTLYASWNGATEIATWEALAGPAPDGLEPVRTVPKDGFETAVRVHTAEPWVGARARDRSGRVLGTSAAVEPENRGASAPGKPHR